MFFSILETIFPRFNAFTLFGVPRGIAQVKTQSLLPAGQAQPIEPKTCEIKLPPSFSALKHSTSGGAWALVSNGFSAASGANLTASGHLIEAFTEQFTMPEISRHKLFTFRFNRCFSRIPHFQSTVATLAVDGHWNYYHWLFDVLPKLHLIETSGVQPDYYYGAFSKPFQAESLNLFGIAQDQLIPSQHMPVISAASLVVTTFPCLQGVPAWAVRFLRKRFIKWTEADSLSPRRLFISRKAAHYRHIVNEEEIYPVLKEKGFVIIQPECLPLEEQVKLFASAEVVFAPHGAGLSNVIFLQPKAKVIEIFPLRFTCPCYWHLCNLTALDYYFLIGEEDPMTYSVECEGYDHIRVSLDKIKHICQLAGL